MKPRYGMLGMTVEAYIRNPSSRPLAFVPVYIGYEKLIEGKSYLGELYGTKKKRESTLGAIRAIFRLKGHYGKVTTSFGEPIVLDDLLQQHSAEWRGEILQPKPDWYQPAMQELGDAIMRGISRACVVNPVNTLATVLLATPRQSIETEELINQSRLLHNLIRRATSLASIRIEAEVDAACIEELAKQKFVHIRHHELGDVVYLKPEDAVLLGYYRNNSLHCLVIPALIACCFNNIRRVSRADVHHKIDLLYPFLKFELQLEWPASQLAAVVDEFIDCLVHESLLEARGTDLVRVRRNHHGFMQLIRLADIVQPILERYYMTFILLWQTSPTPLEDRELEHQCHLLAQKISMLYGINSPDFFDRGLFRDFIATMIDMGYLRRNPDRLLEFSPGFDFVSLDLRNLLSAEVRSSILAIIKTNPHDQVHPAGQ